MAYTIEVNPMPTGKILLSQLFKEDLKTTLKYNDKEKIKACG
jgi:hypothetical protein